MSALNSPRVRIAAAAAGLVLLGGLIGFGAGELTHRRSAPEQAHPNSRRVLYWYDPMVPGQHFDKPGKSPFMDMDLVPKYADEASGGAGVQVSSAATQTLGMRLATAERGALPSNVAAAGVLAFNERDVAIVQARANGFVQRVYGRAPGDVVGTGAPLADILVPEWAGAQGEFLAVRRTGNEALTRAARQRLLLLGMSASLVSQVERTGRVRNVTTVSVPMGGVIRTLTVRNGMTVAAGQTLAEVNGLGRVWLNVAVPEAMASEVRLGQSVTATLTAYPGQSFAGKVTAILPQAETESRTVTARVELPNGDGRLRPGMFASAEFGGMAQPALLVPSEALIRTGRRTLVMLAQPGGRFAPAEVRTGREAGGRTEVLAGLSEGEKVVASGQFLLDSEASLAGVQPRPATATPRSAPRTAIHESTGRVEQIAPDRVTLSHEPVPALGWPAMTMQFKLASPSLAQGVRVGDRVAFSFEEQTTGPVVRTLRRVGGQ